MLSTLLTTLLIIDSLFLVLLVVLLQNGSEGGLGGGLGGGSNTTGFFGASGANRTIVKITWICGVLFFVLALSLDWTQTHNRYALKGIFEHSLAPATTPAAPTHEAPPTGTPTAPSATPPAESAPVLPPPVAAP